MLDLVSASVANPKHSQWYALGGGSAVRSAHQISEEGASSPRRVEVGKNHG